MDLVDLGSDIVLQDGPKQPIGDSISSDFVITFCLFCVILAGAFSCAVSIGRIYDALGQSRHLAARTAFLKTSLPLREWASSYSIRSVDRSVSVDHDEVGINDLRDGIHLICLLPLEDHDKVCDSNNTACRHVFHKDCMVVWLLRHEECPVCRNPYLVETV